QSLLYSVEKMVNGANAHVLRTVLFLYQESKARSKHRARYERLLRSFLADATRQGALLEDSKMLCAQSRMLCAQSKSLRAKSKTLTEEMTRLRRETRQD